MSAAPVRVVYIAGYGHSGSTLLNIILGQHPAVVGAGELFRLAGAAWANREYCSCGEPLPRCPVWSEIVRRWAAHVGGDPIATYARLQATFEGWLPRRRGDAGWSAYAALTRGLFHATSEVTGRSIVVDASKLPGRARALAAVGDIDLRLVHLIRDGRGVAWSLRRHLASNPRLGLQVEKRERSVVRTALMWMATNLAAERVATKLPASRRLRLGYESLMSEPEAAMAGLGELCGLDLSAVARDISAGAPMASGHVMAGNRLRMGGQLRLAPDFEWQRRLPAKDRRLLDRLCRPLLARYGYARSSSR